MADLDPPAQKKPRSPRGRQQPVNDSPDPVEIAMKAVAAGAVPGSAAQTVLEKHACLIDIQCRREREELGNVRVQRITRWLILGSVAALLLGLVALLWTASASTALVVEPFRVPQEMAQRGVDGPAVAAQLLDRLAELQEQTQSGRAASSYANNWGDNLTVALPETGVSLGEAWRFLSGWLGNETRITGEVWRSTDGSITVTARAGANPARSFTGPETELRRLMTQAAESVYSVTQPYRFFVYANNNRRFAEAEAIAARLIASADPEERRWAHVAMANLTRERGDLAASSRAARDALALDPQFSVAMNNLAINADFLGHQEKRLGLIKRSLPLQARNLRDERYHRAVMEVARTTNRTSVEALSGDFASAVALEEAVGTMNASRARIALLEIISWHLALHDLSAAGRAAEALSRVSDNNDVEDLALLADRRLRIAVASGDQALRQRLAEAVTAADRYATHPDPYRHGLGRLWKARNGWTAEALALSTLGEHAAALAVAQRTPLDCYDCLIMRGEVFAAAGDRRGAQRWFADAARQGPSLAFAHSKLGAARLAWGDPAGAIALLGEAHRRAPRFADPLKHWGDALARLGRNEEALQKYEQAAERAPGWGALNIDWGAALWRSGRRDEARAKFRAAVGMALANAERARLQQILARIGRSA